MSSGAEVVNDERGGCCGACGEDEGVGRVGVETEDGAVGGGADYGGEKVGTGVDETDVAGDCVAREEIGAAVMGYGSCGCVRGEEDEGCVDGGCEKEEEEEEKGEEEDGGVGVWDGHFCGDEWGWSVVQGRKAGGDGAALEMHV